MTDPDRFRLLGAYRTPPFRYGQAVFCEVHGEAIITGLTAAPIPWPVGKRPGGRARFVVVCKGLAEAVRREAGLAVAHWWGVAPGTVRTWRRALGVERRTEGSARLWREHGKDRVADALAAAVEKARDPERLRKIGAAQRGRPMPEHVREALQNGRRRVGEPEFRRRISEAMRARGAWPPAAGRPWTAEEDEAVRTLPTDEAARRTGRTAEAVGKRRSRLRRADHNQG